MTEKELSQDIFEMLRELAEAGVVEGLYWERTLRDKTLGKVLHRADWAPSDKRQWDNQVALRDDSGQTVGFVDVSHALVQGLKEKVSLDGRVRSSSPMSQSQFDAAQEALASAENSDSALAQSVYAYMGDPRFQRLVEQEGLRLSDEGLWVNDEARGELRFLQEEDFPATQRELLDSAFARDWAWDGKLARNVPRAVSDSELGQAVAAGREMFPADETQALAGQESSRFRRGVDELFAVAGAWVRVQQPEDTSMDVPVGEFISAHGAREISEELGWQWFDDEVTEPDFEDAPVVVTGAEATIPEEVTEVVVTSVSNVTVDEDTHVVVASEKAEVNERTVRAGWDSFASEVEADSHAEYAFGEAVLDDASVNDLYAEQVALETATTVEHEHSMG